MMENSTGFPLDFMSVAMTSLPKSIPVLSGIYKVSADIRETSERVEVNKQQCEQLSERIDTLIRFLAQRDLSSCLNDAMQIALHRFETFLQQCLSFIEIFVETTWFKRIVNNKDHERKFEHLNRELSQYSNDLNFGIGLNNLKINQNENPTNVESMKDQQQKTFPMVQSDDLICHPDRTTSCLPKSVESSSIGTNFEENIFVSGVWKYKYYQFNQSFGPFQHEIHFNWSNKTLKGFGQDNVGQYFLNGSFCDETGEMRVIQQYQIGTGNSNLNFGHRDSIELIWNNVKQRFEGVARSQLVGLCSTPTPVVMSLQQPF